MPSHVGPWRRLSWCPIVQVNDDWHRPSLLRRPNPTHPLASAGGGWQGRLHQDYYQWWPNWHCHPHPNPLFEGEHHAKSRRHPFCFSLPNLHIPGSSSSLCFFHFRVFDCPIHKFLPFSRTTLESGASLVPSLSVSQFSSMEQTRLGTIQYDCFHMVQFN